MPVLGWRDHPGNDRAHVGHGALEAPGCEDGTCCGPGDAAGAPRDFGGHLGVSNFETREPKK